MLEQVPEALRDALARGALIIAVIVGLWLLRYVVIWLLTRPLEHLAERAGAPQLDDRLRDIVTLPVQLAFYGAAVLAVSLLLNLDQVGRGIAENIARTLFIIAIVAAFYRGLEVVGFSRSRLYTLTGLNLEESLLPFVRVGLQLVLLAFAVVILVQVWGYDVSALVAGLGIGGLAISLAAQDTIANLFGFSMIVGDRPFVVGDTIKTPDVEGTVERVGLRSTRIRQPDQALVTVPNKVLANSVIKNWSRLSKRYLDFTLSIPPDERPKAVETLVAEIREMLEIRPRVETDSILVRFTGISDTALQIQVTCYVLIVNWTEFTQERETINLEIIRIMRATLRGGATAVVTTPIVDMPAEPMVPEVPMMEKPN
jgi:MscS family membrane protein